VPSLSDHSSVYPLVLPYVISGGSTRSTAVSVSLEKSVLLVPDESEVVENSKDEDILSSEEELDFMICNSQQQRYEPEPSAGGSNDDIFSEELRLEWEARCEEGKFLLIYI
jgi:hypothetical protein